jgi:hypothetical protein
MKTTKKEKVERFDAVSAERDKFMLALYDLANDKFSKPVYRDENDYVSGQKRNECKLRVRMSWRAMPLFLIEWLNGGVQTSMNVLTETEMEDITRDPYSTGNRMLLDAFEECKYLYYPKAA